MTKEWTIMAYMAGDNNLEDAAVRDLVEMKAVGSTDQVQVIAQLDKMSDSVTRRYYLTREPLLDNDVVLELPETNTGDPASLVDFIRWGMNEYPAERTALILWNHGAGWKDDDLYALGQQVGLSAQELPRSLVRGVSQRSLGRSLFATSIQNILRQPGSVRAILFDDTSKDFLDNTELKSVLDQVLAARNGRKLDLIGFDACLMNMVEVAAQVQHACDYMVGSQEVEPEDGWSYAAILAAVVAEPEMSAAGLARTIVETYARYYDERRSTTTVTQSALDLSQLPPLMTALCRLADSLTLGLTSSAFYNRSLMPSLRQVQKFRDEQYIDLGHFGRLLASVGLDEAVEAAAREVGELLDPAAPTPLVVATCVVAPGGRTTSVVAKTARTLLPANPATAAVEPSVYGLSIYMPLVGIVSPAYGQLQFARDCSWGRFLDAFVKT